MKLVLNCVKKNFSFFQKKLGPSSWRLKKQTIPIGTENRSWGRSSCHPLAANQARLLAVVLDYDLLLHMLRQFCLMGEEVKRSKKWLIEILIK
jgi:hypothetical protein